LLGYRLGAQGFPLRGDVVVVEVPGEADLHRIRRVIGLPGDRVELRAGVVWLNGKKLDFEPLTSPASANKRLCGKERLDRPVAGASREALPWTHGVCLDGIPLPTHGEVVVPEDFVYLLGDLRSGHPELAGSRALGALGLGLASATSIRGRARWIWLSIRPRSEVSDAAEKSRGWLSRLRFERILRGVDS
jgi:signal peptidase I